jgi:probable HAF family extracellular repeat protein
MAVSDDGSTIVGFSSTINRRDTFRWTRESGMIGLGTPGAKFTPIAWGVSGDGSVIVGGDGYDAFRWTAAEGAKEIVNGGSARDVSADGSVVVGHMSSGGTIFRWTATEGVSLLGGPSIADGISADGLVIVGGGSRWTEESGWEGLGRDGDPFGLELAVSGDGSVIVGRPSMLWTRATGFVNLQEFLLRRGVESVRGWTLTRANDISADGRTIVGTGINPAGEPEGWVATIPEPSTHALLAMAVICAAGRAIFWHVSAGSGDPRRAEPTAES